MQHTLTRLFFTAILIATFSALVAQDTIRVAHYTETTGYNHNTKSQSFSMFSGFQYPGYVLIVDDQPESEFMDTLEVLNRYDVVIWSNTSGNSGLTQNQRSNFEQYINGGGGYLGIHAASDTYRHGTSNGNKTGTWDWYAENVAGASVQENPNHTSSSHNNNMTKQVTGHPTLANVPDPWNKTEEYYYWENGYLNNTFTELLRVGQTGSNSRDNPRMMAHCKEYPNGSRVFYTALGHDKNNFTSSSNLIFQDLMKDALFWVANPPSAAFAIESIEISEYRDSICFVATGDEGDSIRIQHYEGGWITDTTFTTLSGCYKPVLCGTYDVRVFAEGDWGEAEASMTIDFSSEARLEVGRIRLSCDLPPNWPYYVYDTVTGSLQYNGYTATHGGVSYIPYFEKPGTYTYRVLNWYKTINHK